MSATRQYRRVVTGHDSRGASVIISDGAAPAAAGALIEVWSADRTPVDNRDPRDLAATEPVSLEAHPGGSKFRFFVVPPEAELPDEEDRRRALDDRMARVEDKEGQTYLRRLHPDTRRHPGMHRTRSIDYVILLEGEVTLLLDDGEVDLKPFDTVVQRGTNHAWVNHGSTPALLAGVLVDAELLD